MNRQEYLNKLDRAMAAQGITGRQAHLAFFEEMLDDMAEDGIGEEEAVKRLGDPEDLAAAIAGEEARSEEEKNSVIARPAPDLPRNGGAQGTKSGALLSLLGSGLASALGIRRTLPRDPSQMTGSTREFSPAGIRELTISWTAGRIDVSVYDGESVKVTEQRMEDDPPFIAERNGDALSVRYSSDAVRFFSGEKRLEVCLPRALAETLALCRIDAVSADVFLPGLRVDEMQIKTVSGDVGLSAVRARHAAVTTVSGDVSGALNASGSAINTSSGDLDVTLGGDEARLNAASGDIRCGGRVSALTINSASGDIGFDGSALLVRADSASGDCSLVLRERPESVKAKTVSGDLDIALPAGYVWSVKTRTVSGSVKVNCVRSDEKDAAGLTAQTVSGDIMIHD